MVLRMIRLDDMTGEEDAETVTIVVNDRGIELDLTERSMAKLTKALEPFWSVGSEARYTVTRGSASKKDKKERDWTHAEVRAWAVENGIEVGAIGRVPMTIVEKYLAAQ